MTCYCGDPCCPSCGPAQGYCPRCYELELDECECDYAEDYDIDEWEDAA